MSEKNISDSNNENLNEDDDFDYLELNDKNESNIIQLSKDSEGQKKPNEDKNIIQIDSDIYDSGDEEENIKENIELKEPNEDKNIFDDDYDDYEEENPDYISKGASLARSYVYTVFDSFKQNDTDKRDNISSKVFNEIFNDEKELDTFSNEITKSEEEKDKIQEQIKRLEEKNSSDGITELNNRFRECNLSIESYKANISNLTEKIVSFNKQLSVSMNQLSERKSELLEEINMKNKDLSEYDQSTIDSIDRALDYIKKDSNYLDFKKNVKNYNMIDGENLAEKYVNEIRSKISGMGDKYNPKKLDKVSSEILGNFLKEIRNANKIDKEINKLRKGLKNAGSSSAKGINSQIEKSQEALNNILFKMIGFDSKLTVLSDKLLVQSVELSTNLKMTKQKPYDSKEHNSVSKAYDYIKQDKNVVSFQRLAYTLSNSNTNDEQNQEEENVNSEKNNENFANLEQNTEEIQEQIIEQNQETNQEILNQENQEEFNEENQIEIKSQENIEENIENQENDNNNNNERESDDENDNDNDNDTEENIEIISKEEENIENQDEFNEENIEKNNENNDENENDNNNEENIENIPQEYFNGADLAENYVYAVLDSFEQDDTANLKAFSDGIFNYLSNKINDFNTIEEQLNQLQQNLNQLQQNLKQALSSDENISKLQNDVEEVEKVMAQKEEKQYNIKAEIKGFRDKLKELIDGLQADPNELIANSENDQSDLNEYKKQCDLISTYTLNYIFNSPDLQSFAEQTDPWFNDPNYYGAKLAEDYFNGVYSIISNMDKNINFTALNDHSKEIFNHLSDKVNEFYTIEEQLNELQQNLKQAPSSDENTSDLQNNVENISSQIEEKNKAQNNILLELQAFYNKFDKLYGDLIIKQNELSNKLSNKLSDQNTNKSGLDDTEKEYYLVSAAIDYIYNKDQNANSVLNEMVDLFEDGDENDIEENLEEITEENLENENDENENNNEEQDQDEDNDQNENENEDLEKQEPSQEPSQEQNPEQNEENENDDIENIKGNIEIINKKEETEEKENQEQQEEELKEEIKEDDIDIKDEDNEDNNEIKDKDTEHSEGWNLAYNYFSSVTEFFTPGKNDYNINNLNAISNKIFQPIHKQIDELYILNNEIAELQKESDQIPDDKASSDDTTSQLKIPNKGINSQIEKKEAIRNNLLFKLQGLYDGLLNDIDVLNEEIEECKNPSSQENINSYDPSTIKNKLTLAADALNYIQSDKNVEYFFSKMANYLNIKNKDNDQNENEDLEKQEPSQEQNPEQNQEEKNINEEENNKEQNNNESNGDGDGEGEDDNDKDDGNSEIYSLDDLLLGD